MASRSASSHIKIESPAPTTTGPTHTTERMDKTLERLESQLLKASVYYEAKDYRKCICIAHNLLQHNGIRGYARVKVFYWLAICVPNQHKALGYLESAKGLFASLKTSDWDEEKAAEVGEMIEKAVVFGGNRVDEKLEEMHPTSLVRDENGNPYPAEMVKRLFRKRGWSLESLAERLQQVEEFEREEEEAEFEPVKTSVKGVKIEPKDGDVMEADCIPVVAGKPKGRMDERAVLEHIAIHGIEPVNDRIRWERSRSLFEEQKAAQEALRRMDERKAEEEARAAVMRKRAMMRAESDSTDDEDEICSQELYKCRLW